MSNNKYVKPELLFLKTCDAVVVLMKKQRTVSHERKVEVKNDDVQNEDEGKEENKKQEANDDEDQRSRTGTKWRIKKKKWRRIRRSTTRRT